ncbi:molybdopterin biosynthesis protein [uncultured Celeribacter sp.]|uniref:molybdopterin biosynthesis protein n=1 Tax=uncultured Celeribacter sp. TaxID=1303376 RepID=UPI002AA73966|nr:molybdopterin biosynthesis protein [uncultured Celeribacter sp.]
MIFDTRPLRTAKGAFLARDITLSSGVQIARGRQIGPEDIAALTMAGITEIPVVEAETHDVAADEAVERLSKALVPNLGDASLRREGTQFGCIDLIATAPGVVGLDTQGITRMNRVDEGIAVITTRQFQRVSAGEVVAKLGIVPLAVKRSALSRVLSEGEDMIRLRPVLAETVTLIQTVERGDAGQGAEAAIRARLAPLGLKMAESLVVAHREEALAEALLSVTGDVVLILPARATVDRHDVAPEAVRRAGGVITRFGIPVDPGASMFAGGLGSVPILGLPDSARLTALSGTDSVFERLVCGVSISDDDLADLGVGGLLPRG